MVEVFTDVADTPMFRQKVCDLEAGAKRLRDRCSGFVVGTRKYRDGVAAMHDAEVSFASALHDFCGGNDEDSLLIGGAVMSKFVSTFRELASFHDVLRAQVDVCLVEILQQTWVDGTLSKVRDDQKRFDKKMQEHEQARIKYLALKKVTKKEVLEKAHAELVATRVAAEDLRFEIARKLSEVECRKRYMFLEAVTSSMHFHLQFFEHAHSLLKGLEPLINQTWEIVDHLKQEEEARTKHVEGMVSQFKQQSADRERLLEQLHTVEEVGPLQMSASKQLLLQEIEALIWNTHISGGTQVTIIKQAYLHKKSNQLRNDWKRRFFVLDSQGMLYYYSHKDAGMMGSLRKHKPKNTVNLLTSTVKLDDEDRSMRFCFRVVSPEGTYTLQAENELERHEWVDSLQAVINCLLSGDAPARNISRIPAKPTHSRSNSAASDYDPLSNSSFSSTACSTMMSVQQFPGKLMAEREPSPSAPLERLRSIPGNRFCVDCGAMDPNWASLNLGVLMCIECSGLHRQLGVHVSKVRSCTLDVKVWEPAIISIFEALGNQYAIQVWEANLQRTIRKADSWVWCDDSDDDEESPSQPLAPKRGAASNEPMSREHLLEMGMACSKPTTTSPLGDKQKYIVEKYMNRSFVTVLPLEEQKVRLWEAVERGDIKSAYHALACGVDINVPHSSQKALALVQDTQNLTGGPTDDSKDDSIGHATVLHLAGAIGNKIMMEFLLQNNARLECVDTFNRSALHYCILHERANCAKILLKRGAPVTTKDLVGRTPFDFVMLRGRVSDEELFVLLSSTK